MVYLTDDSVATDEIKIVHFGTNVFQKPSAYEIHKDMLNVYHFKRFAQGEVQLAQALNYYDTSLTVTNGSLLGTPDAERNLSGIVWIGGERIEYLQKSGNVLSQLRRGSYGTSIKDSYPVGSEVVDLGIEQTIPYTETQDRYDFYSDGSTLLVGPLPFVPTKSTRTTWAATSIPDTYGPCDDVEVFVAGRRLRKDSITVYDETLGASSPAADKTLEAEFSVDGTSAVVRLTSAVEAGTRISIIRRTGKSWYDRGLTTATSGITFLDNTTIAAKFVAAKTTDLPE